MTVEEQMLMKSLAAECERLHKELQTKEKYINYLKEDKKTLYTRCDETARDAFKMGTYGRIRITSISEFVRLHKELEKHRWIPVSERIPGDGRYLFSLPDRGGTIMCGDVMFGKFFSDDYEQTSDDVIAWMPLPEPYQKGEQE